MSKITIITASARNEGNSLQMAQWFAQEAERLGAQVATFDAIQLNIGGCHACNACFKTPASSPAEERHACAFEHDFDPVAQSVLASDIIVFSVPVYYFSMPGHAKNILDHFYSFLIGRKKFGGKTLIALGTSGQAVESDVFEGVRVTLKKSADFIGWAYDELSYGNMNLPGSILDTDAEAKVKALAQKYVK